MKIISKQMLFIFLLVCPVVFTVQAADRPGPVSLIPLPQSLKWTGEKFDLKKCNTIILKRSSLKKEAIRLQQMLAETGNAVKIIDSTYAEKYAIELNIGVVKASYHPGEAYSLQVKNDLISLTANSAHGIFNGLQTLYQLINDGRFVQGCSIEDYPAYKWRGYMVDAGRNYQSPGLLKQQIDKMARYKLNVFHFHLTEDIAWRLQIKQYPQLTAPEHMQRNKGKYYSIDQMKELIQYCKDKYITLVPEIDMPGHSAAFARAMGAGMQTDKGFEIVKNIVKEVCTTYDVPYIHIGADEVKITNEKFLPEVSRLIQQHRKTVIGWAPGGNYNEGTIHQLWKDEGDKNAGKPIKYIDSRFLYISDFDPMNSVVTIFNRQMGEKLHGDPDLLGAEFCLWSDRRVVQEFDLVNMNPVYPAMLAFSERCWRGGGFPGIVFSIGTDSSERAKAFVEFEKRLLDHKQKYFKRLPFNYVKQTHIKWNLFGPFENHGDVSSAYWPEKQNTAIEDSVPVIKATGGTIWLWHTHGPPVKAWLSSPKENTTWYAFTRFWSNTDSVINIWMDFKDQSKSGADATPPKGEWDYMQSKLWINDELIPPPQWAFPGRAAGQLEEPLVNEGFYYRSPAPVKVKKGWNKILVKLPVSTFNPLLDWQAPPKWMFTVIPVHREDGINYAADEIKFDPDNRLD
jgi:hexosaminidase